MNRRFSTPVRHRRRGSMVPALAIALLVVGGAIALVFDRLWQDAALLELRAAGEAAALAAAGRLADDDTLKKEVDWEAVCQSARTAAAEIAVRNRVGGMPVELWDDEDGQVELGTLVTDYAGEQVFVRTTEQPDFVAVHVEQGRGHSNPVGLLARDLTGAGRLLKTTVEAKVDHQIAGVRPYEGVNVPMLPIAVSGIGPTGWSVAVDAGAGPDTCGMARGTATVVPGPDGIGEMTVWSAPGQATTREQLLATLHVFDIGNGLDGRDLADQCRDGWSPGDLRKHNGELRIDGRPLKLKSTPKIPGEVGSALSEMVGQVRLCLVYDALLPGTSPDQFTIVSRRLVAVRILGVQRLPDQALAILLQPAVLVTRTAVTSDGAETNLKNPYVCKVQLAN